MLAWKNSKYKCLGPRYEDYRGEYKVWQHLIDRCTKEKNPMYYCYGARGVKVCPEWLDKDTGFIQFYKDMGPRPREENGRPYQLDRIDVNGDYCPENCRWVTLLQNARNKRSGIPIYLWGERYCLSEACEVLGLKRETVASRIYKSGVSPTDAVADGLIKNKNAKEVPAC